jgi:NAD(P)-dependent dehydrogenase (short-subunit alcohol dehydrogenase family)
MLGPFHQIAASNNGLSVAMVTGATGTIGRAIARQIAGQEGYALVLLCRDEQKGQAAAEEIRRATGNEHVWYELADVSRKSAVFSLAERWPGRLDVLVNNAAIVPQQRQETPEGIELQFATNVLGYVWMTQAFGEQLRRSAPARVVNVASFWAGDLLLDDLEFKRRRYTANEAYRQAKQANRMLTPAFAERFRLHQVTVNACHPGVVESKLLGNLGYSGRESPDDGAGTPVWLATGTTGGVLTGKYFRDKAEFPCMFAEDKTAVEALYEACLRY